MSGRATVVHLSTVHRADDPRIFHKECRTLAAAGYDVHLVAAGAADGDRHGVRVWGVPRAAGGRRARMTTTVRDVVRRAWALDPDLLHVHDPELVPAAVALARAGRTVVYDAHEDLAATVRDKAWIRPRLRAPLARVIEGVEAAAAGRLAAVVTATAPIAERFAGCPCEVVAVNNFPDAGAFAAVPRPAPEDPLAVCYVGGLSTNRGIETMLAGVAKADARLLLAGTWDPPALGARLRGSPAWARVVDHGRVGRPELAGIFARAAAGVVVLRPTANYVRSNPTKMFEYMSAGLPVIASRFPLWRSVVEGNRCGICVDPLDADELAEAIRWIGAHREEARRMGENGRRAVEATYSWEPEGRRLVALYGRLLAAPPARGAHLRCSALGRRVWAIGS